MPLVAILKLTCNHEQKALLRATLRACNIACNWLSEQAFSLRCFAAFDLHKLFYRALRESFGLSSQLAIRALGKVGDAYKRDHSVQIELTKSRHSKREEAPQKNRKERSQL
jgi:putative transposase